MKKEMLSAEDLTELLESTNNTSWIEHRLRNHKRVLKLCDRGKRPFLWAILRDAFEAYRDYQILQNQVWELQGQVADLEKTVVHLAKKNAQEKN